MKQNRIRNGIASRPARQGGFTLVELMVSITISLVILAALVAIFVNTSRSNREMARANSLIEYGRLAIQVLENDIVHSGYWTGFVPSYDDHTFDGTPADAPTAVPDPCLAYSVANWTPGYITNLIGIPLQAYDAAAVGTCSITSLQGNSDVLVVRHAGTCAAGAPNCAADVAGTLYFQASRCESDAVDYVLDTGGHTLRRRNCAVAPVAEKRRFVSTIYYVRDFALTVGDGIPTLVRSQFDASPGALAHQAAVPIIEGVQSLRVELGIDDVSETNEAVVNTAPIAWYDPAGTGARNAPRNRGDGTPDGAFVRCTTAAPCSAAQLTNATAVKLFVLARSREPSQGHTDTKTYDMGSGLVLGPYNDAFKRHLFVTTVRLPNVAARRETP